MAARGDEHHAGSGRRSWDSRRCGSVPTGRNGQAIASPACSGSWTRTQCRYGRSRAAAACELLHEASLVHDDLQDRDTMRRGRGAIWYTYSDELAITLGDWLINQAYDVILSAKTPARLTRNLYRALSKAVAETVRGQAIENEHKDSLTTSTPDYIDMATGKTAPLLAFPLEAVCYVAGRSSAECAAIRSGLEALGGAYQAR